MKSPVKKIFITQKFGDNPEAYAKFGYKGHNGIDYRAFLPNGEKCYEGGKSEVFAPHAGKVVENQMDSNGYGWYVKIENEIEGSVLAHFHTQSPVKVGQEVKEGQLVGYQGTTGNSSGIHLHWGYYLKPRDRQNGYGGFINQEGLYAPYGEDMSNELDACLKDRKKFWDERDSLLRELQSDNVEGGLNTIRGLRARITDLGNQLGTAQAEVANREEQVSRVKGELLTLQKVLEERTAQVNLFAREKGELTIQVEQLKVQVDTLKQAQQQGEVTITLKEFLHLLFNQKITIKK